MERDERKTKQQLCWICGVGGCSFTEKVEIKIEKSGILTPKSFCSFCMRCDGIPFGYKI